MIISLRIQLLGLGLLTLALPWAGYRYVQELEGALRSGLVQSLLASADTMAAALGGQELSMSAANPSAAATARLTSEPVAIRMIWGFGTSFST